MKKKMKGFTLVELLAVIAVIGLILIIAVPKVMETLNKQKKRTLELTTRSIIKAAEEKYIENSAYGLDDEITCEGITNITNSDFKSCTISFDDNGNASVTIIGKGRYEGLTVCNGTKTSATATKGGCGLSCNEEEAYVQNVNVTKPYEVNDIDACVSVITAKITAVGMTDFVQFIEPLCNGQEVLGFTFDGSVNNLINLTLFTEEELVESNVIKPIERESVKICMPNKSINGVTYLSNMVKDENAKKAFGLIEDNTVDQNIRFVGRNPYNKVYFNCADTDGTNEYGSENYDYDGNCEIWRIIGVFNTKSTDSKTEDAVPRIKIVRDAVLDTLMAWDTTADGVDSLNQWGETTLVDGTTSYAGASLKQYLNDDEESYYNSLSSIAKGQVEEVIWNTGALEFGNGDIPKLNAYNQERSNATGTSTTVKYTTNWKGKIGLIYPSDYGYASNMCNNIFALACGQNNWMNNYEIHYWTLTSRNDGASEDRHGAWLVHPDGQVGNYYADTSWGVRPALYLSSNTEIIGGDGSENNPYKLS